TNHTTMTTRHLETEHHQTDVATTRPVVSGTQGVISAGHPLVSMAGMRMLLAGGNAFDAVVAAGFAAAVVEPTASYTLCGECGALHTGRGARRPRARRPPRRDGGGERPGHRPRAGHHRLFPRPQAGSHPHGTGARRASVLHGAGSRRRLLHRAGELWHEEPRRGARARAPLRGARLPDVRVHAQAPRHPGEPEPVRSLSARGHRRLLSW